MTVDEENARVEEIRQKVLAYGEAQYIDGLNKGKEYIEALEAERSSYNDGYTKGLEDMWDVWHWYSHESANNVHDLFPEKLKEGYAYFVDFVEKIGLAEAVRRYKEDKKADAQILYSTISDLKADYTNEQIIKALKDNGIEDR